MDDGRSIERRPGEEDVPAVPRPVPGAAMWREFLFPLGTGASWLSIGTIALVVARLEGLPPPEQASRAIGAAWMVGLIFIVAGGALLSWALVRGLMWSRLQRYGRATEAFVVEAEPLAWLEIGGRSPLALDLRYRDQHGSLRRCRLWAQQSGRFDPHRAGDSLVLVHSTRRPDQAELYWDR